jgi:cyanophycinase-like exopeptidase
MTAQQAPIQPGSIVLMGSGETSPSAQKIFHRVFSSIADSGDNVRMAILETPAGFEPNSGYVAEQVARFVEKRLQNFTPAITIVPARKRGAAGFSTDDPRLAAQLHDANVIFMGPGSPTYAVRQLQQSLIWETVRACHRQGTALVFSSAATLAASCWTLPVYEIYKAGADLYWQPGLDFFGAFGLPLILVSHWNNGDGGTVLDTSRCYMGQHRFQALLDITPGKLEDYALVGIDESTALALDAKGARCTVIGVGTVTIIRAKDTSVYAAGEQFSAMELGDFCLPEQAAGIDGTVWQATLQGRLDGARARSAVPAPDSAVLALLAAREEARVTRNWQESDRLRDEIARLGWRVQDTGRGQRVEPA